MADDTHLSIDALHGVYRRIRHSGDDSCVVDRRFNSQSIDLKQDVCQGVPHSAGKRSSGGYLPRNEAARTEGVTGTSDDGALDTIDDAVITFRAHDTIVPRGGRSPRSAHPLQTVRQISRPNPPSAVAGTGMDVRITIGFHSEIAERISRWARTRTRSASAPR